MARPKQTKLSAQQKKFCQQWVINFNLADAWLAAGYIVKYRRTAERCASRFMLSNVVGQKYIEELLKGQEQRAEKSADDIIREFEKIGFSNIEDYLSVDDDGEVQLRSFKLIDREKLAVIESIKINTRYDNKGRKEHTTTQFKLCSKLSALELLGKRYKLFTEKHEYNLDKETAQLLGLIDGSTKGVLPADEKKG